ncbi:sigma-70 family RNA polymerase sigma factor [Planctomycetota bacterium]
MDRKDKFYLKITKHRSSIMAVIVAMVRDFGAAEDVFQDTVVQILASAERFDDARDFLPWANGIARNIVRRHFKKLRRAMTPMEQADLEYLGSVMDDAPPADTVDEERAALRYCMQRVNTRNKKLLNLRYGENLKGKALADSVGLKELSVRGILKRIRDALRDCIERRVKDIGSGEMTGYEQPV